MSVNHMSKTACVVGAVAVLVLAGCSGGDKKESIGDPLSHAAKGELSAAAVTSGSAGARE